MHILLIADGRSPITHRWVQSVLHMQHRVSLISTYPCQPIPGVERMEIMAVAFARLGGGQVAARANKRPGALRTLAALLRGPFLLLRQFFGPISVTLSAKRYKRLVAEIQPDLVHALRIPFEGMLGEYTPPGIPLIVSIWGNDLTLHAPATGGMVAYTRRVLARANGLMADAQRDLGLAQFWGYDPEKPCLMVPGSSGIDLEEIDRVAPDPNLETKWNIPAGAPLVINPRGLRSYVRTDTFYQAIPLVLQRRPDVIFACTHHAGQPEAEGWVQHFKIQNNVRLLPGLPQTQLWQLFRRAAVSVSITTHDGTPNTLLEAMACGCVPVAGDIETLREWITPGINGLLVEPGKAQSAAEAILQALDNPQWRAEAAAINRGLIASRAEIHINHAKVDTFYRGFGEKA